MKRIIPILCLACIFACWQTRADNYDGAWNTPTVGTTSVDSDLFYFGQIGYRARTFRERSLHFPAIPELSHRSVYALCPKDTCFAEYAVLALRCPPVQTLLDWVSERVCAFANSCVSPDPISEDDSKRIKKQKSQSANSICEYYIQELGKTFKSWPCNGYGDSDSINEQNGLLIVDCWKSGPLYTFYEGTWYDMMSSGDTTQKSYRTIDSRTGKELTLSDFVDPANYSRLSRLLMPRLANEKNQLLINQYSSTYTIDDKNLVSLADGYALIREGLIIYYHPYTLGTGADGAYQAIIPYIELEGILKIK